MWDSEYFPSQTSSRKDSTTGFIGNHFSIFEDSQKSLRNTWIMSVFVEKKRNKERLYILVVANKGMIVWHIFFIVICQTFFFLSVKMDYYSIISYLKSLIDQDCLNPRRQEDVNK